MDQDNLPIYEEFRQTAERFLIEARRVGDVRAKVMGDRDWSHDARLQEFGEFDISFTDEIRRCGCCSSERVEWYIPAHLLFKPEEELVSFFTDEKQRLEAAEQERRRKKQQQQEASRRAQYEQLKKEFENEAA